MNDIEKRARELLAAEWSKLSFDAPAEELISGCELPPVIAAGVRAIIAALTTPDGWVRAVDRELVTAEIGVANPDDSFEVASQKLHELIMWHVKVATDPAVNGGFLLVPVEPTEEMLVAGYGWQSAGAYLEESWKAMVDARPEVNP